MAIRGAAGVDKMPHKGMKTHGTTPNGNASTRTVAAVRCLACENLTDGTFRFCTGHRFKS